MDGCAFRKPNYPNNQVVTNFAPPLLNNEPGFEGLKTGRGDFSVVSRWDSVDGKYYYYLYYLDRVVEEEGEDRKVNEYGAVARAEVSLNGPPATWMKNYYSGGWNVSAINGPAARIPGLVMSRASIYVPANEVVRVRQRPAFGGVLMTYSPDPVGFTSGAVTEPLVYMNECDSYEAPSDPDPDNPKEDPCDDPDTDDVDPGNPQGQRLLYTSIVAPSGGSEWDNTFYLFYVYGLPGEQPENFESRYLVRRKVTVGSRQPDGPQTKLALGLYESKNARPNSVWSTAGVVPATHQYFETTGYIMTMPGEDRDYSRTA